VTTAHVNRAKQQIAEQFAGHVDTKVYNHAAVLASSFCRGRACAGKDARRKRTGRPREFSIRFFPQPSTSGMAKRTERYTIHRSLDRWHPRAAGRKRKRGLGGRPPGARGVQGARPSDVTDTRAGCRSSVPTLGFDTGLRHWAPTLGSDTGLRHWAKESSRAKPILRPIVVVDAVKALNVAKWCMSRGTLRCGGRATLSAPLSGRPHFRGSQHRATPIGSGGIAHPKNEARARLSTTGPKRLGEALTAPTTRTPDGRDATPRAARGSRQS